MMNRIAKLTVAFSVLLCGVSCVEKINADITEEQNYITVTSGVSPDVKAGYSEDVLPAQFRMDISDPNFGGTMSRAGSSNSYNFPSGQNPVWGFADVSQVYVKAITAPTGYNRSTGAMTINPDQRSDANIQASDLLGAYSGNGIEIRNNNINVNFTHLMAKLHVSYTSTFEIDRIVLNGVCTGGTYSYAEMKYAGSNSTRANITMYHSAQEKYAEAIFFPYRPESSEVIKLQIYLKNGNGTKLLESPITLKGGTSFDGGKCYMMNINISGDNVNSSKVSVESWVGGAGSQTSGERVLWIGTSIPAGDGNVSYPQLVDEAMNCTIINNAVPGSLVIKRKDASWIDAHGWNQLMAGGLSQSHAEVEAIYRPKAVTSGYDAATQEWWLNEVKKLSYESLIIPYIDGTLDKCTTVILDHGFNDRTQMILEAGGHQVEGGHIWGYNYLMNLKNKKEGYTYQDYLNKLSTDANILALNQNYYIVEMSHIISKIREINPNIRIIIGNYFTLDCPYVAREYEWFAADYPNYKSFGSVICYFNEALAGIWDLDIVNVQNYLWMSEDEYWAGWDYVNNAPIYDATKFCPDGVHPYSLSSAQAIADIYIRELDGVIGSRIK